MRWIKPNVKGRKPCARYFHALTMIGDAVIVIGGKDDHMRFNDVHVFNKDPKCSQWTQPHIRGTPPKQRSAHTVNVVGNKLYVFGGHRDGEKFNDVQILDTSCMTWMSPKIKGYPPGKRNAHTATTFGTTIYVFGGFDGESCNDLYMLDTETLTWNQPEFSGNPPSRRCCHSATLVQDTIWVFAGKNNDAEGVIDRFNDIYQLDTRVVPHRWMDPSPRVTGTPPSKRNAHSACSVGRHLLIFGGFDGESCNDLFWFDTQTLMWQEISCFSTSPAARYCHAAVGFTVPAHKPGEQPSQAVLVFGGCDADRNYADCQMLEIPGDEIPGMPQAEPQKNNEQLQQIERLGTRCEELMRQTETLKQNNDKLTDQVDQQTSLIKMLQSEKQQLETRARAAEDAHQAAQQQQQQQAQSRPSAPADGGRRRRKRGRQKNGAMSPGQDDDDEEYAFSDEERKPPAGGLGPDSPQQLKSQGDTTLDGESDEDDPDDDSGRRKRREKRKKRKDKKGKSAKAERQQVSAPVDDDDGEEEEDGISDSRSGSNSQQPQRPPGRGGGGQYNRPNVNSLNLNELGPTNTNKLPNTVPGRLPALGPPGGGGGGGLLPSLNTDRPSMLGGALV